jgi:CheY-like chemotaxis protein
MPVMNGKEVLTILRGSEKYNDINILVFTNMSNSVMEEELLKTGATKVVTKIDIQALAKTITQYMKK